MSFLGGSFAAMVPGLSKLTDKDSSKSSSSTNAKVADLETLVAKKKGKIGGLNQEVSALKSRLDAAETGETAAKAALTEIAARAAQESSAGASQPSVGVIVLVVLAALAVWWFKFRKG